MKHWYIIFSFLMAFSSIYGLDMDWSEMCSDENFRLDPKYLKHVQTLAICEFPDATDADSAFQLAQKSCKEMEDSPLSSFQGTLIPECKLIDRFQGLSHGKYPECCYFEERVSSFPNALIKFEYNECKHFNRESCNRQCADIFDQYCTDPISAEEYMEWSSNDDPRAADTQVCVVNRTVLFCECLDFTG